MLEKNAQRKIYTVKSLQDRLQGRGVDLVKLVGLDAYLRSEVGIVPCRGSILMVQFLIDD